MGDLPRPWKEAAGEPLNKHMGCGTPLGGSFFDGRSGHANRPLKDVDGELLRFWIGDQLVETAARRTTGEVGNKRAFRANRQAHTTPGEEMEKHGQA
ncbi:hypothetical protein NGTWS1803_03490 [Mycolicibacterium cyprinidarum]|nr:hypothetical protein NGTWS1803_03490 [Mycolicibacterium sp. NGTWS1803]